MTDESRNEEQPPARGFEALKAHAIANKIEVALWFIRMLTIVFCIGFVLPIFNNASNAYYKALLANAATSALRLHHRLPSVTISREFFAQLLMEDSCHYLFYSMIFMYSKPLTLVIIPIGFFALLHAASYSLPLLDAIGQNSCWFARLLISLVELQSRNILRVVSLAEIMLMPFCVVMLMFGQVALITTILYYHFLKWRYSSRRNPYTRNMFHELRLYAEKTASRPMTPAFIGNFIRNGIALMSKLAPPMHQAQQ